jgi:glycine cleavage system H protein
MTPADRRYVESHEWALKSGELVTVGITSFAVEHLSDLTYLALPEVGSRLERGQRFGEIESVKAVSELFAPVSGEVTEVNTALPDALDLLKEDPYQKGWMIRIRPSRPDEYAALLDAAAYDRKVAEES